MSSSIIVIALLSGALLPGESPYSPRYAQCLDAAEGVTADMHDCIAVELERQDARLNHAYRELLAELPASRKQQLVSAQRAWLKYRDENCAFYADPDGGTAAALSAHGCVLDGTAERAGELETLKAPLP